MSSESIPARTSTSTAVRGRRGLVVTAAVAAAIALWLLADPLAGIDLAVQSGGTAQRVGFGAVIFASLFAGLAAWALLAVLERFLARPRRTWTLVATVVLALSLAGPLTGAADATSGIALVALHLVVGAVLIVGLRRSARR
jgi:hypothetical protein